MDKWIEIFYAFYSAFRLNTTRSMVAGDANRWAQVLAGKLEAIPPLHGGLQLSKITKKNNHVPYNMRCWNVILLHPHISGIFLGNVCIYTS